VSSQFTKCGKLNPFVYQESQGRANSQRLIGTLRKPRSCPDQYTDLEDHSSD
jgi:hypothetical protein